MKTLKTGHFIGNNQLTARTNSFIISKTLHHSGESPLHIHDSNYFSILLAGNYSEKSENLNLNVLPGDILFRPKHYLHQNTFKSDDVSCLNIEFEAIELNAPRFYIYKQENKTFFYRLIADFLSRKQVNLDMCDIASELNSLNFQEKYPSNHVWLLKVLAIIHKEQDVFHSLNILADRVHVHPNYLARIFKDNTGKTIGEYQRNAKLNHAVRLLLNTDNSISDITYTHGFYDDAHFIRSFKSAFNITPSKFRKLIKS